MYEWCFFFYGWSKLLDELTYSVCEIKKIVKCTGIYVSKVLKNNYLYP